MMSIGIGRIAAIYLCIAFSTTQAGSIFSETLSKFMTAADFQRADNQQTPSLYWQEQDLEPFKELIISWNALRPDRGGLIIYTSLFVNGRWSAWHKLASWGRGFQKTYLNESHPHVHTKHCRVEVQGSRRATGFRVKVVFKGGAEPECCKALFANVADVSLRRDEVPPALSSVVIKNMPRQSQMVLDHPRYKDLCSPVSTSLLVTYFKETMTGRRFSRRLDKYAKEFARHAHDQNPGLDIYGNWILNTAHAFHETGGEVYFAVRRLNNFQELHEYLCRRVPVAVSVRRLPGGATPYANGHIMVVVGWNERRRRVICIDPAFDSNHATLKSYPIRSFVAAWGRSNNLSYVPMEWKKKSSN